MAEIALAAAGAYIGAEIAATVMLPMWLSSALPSIGWTLGSMAGRTLFAQDIHVEGPKLSDLKVVGVEYGQPIPYVFGAPRVAGQVWWSSDKRAIAHTESQGGGKGGGPEITTTHYTYDVDTFFGLSDNEIGGVSRIWANGKLVWENGVTTTTSQWDSITVYTGSATQLPDPIIEAALGVGSVPAYRGRGAVMLGSIHCDGSGIIPNLSFELIPLGSPTEAPTLKTVVDDLCSRAGLAAAQVDTTAIGAITKRVRGLALSQITSTRTVLEMLSTTHFFDMTISDKLYFVPRAGAVAATIPYADLGYGDPGSEPEPLTFHQISELEVPSQVAITYPNVDADYVTDTQYSDRLVSSQDESTLTLQLPVGFTASEAKAVADSALADQMIGITRAPISVSVDYARLEPSDVVYVVDADGYSWRMRIVRREDLFPEIRLELAMDDATALIDQSITSADYSAAPSPASNPDTTLSDVEFDYNLSTGWGP